jgi:hypothetical protein
VHFQEFENITANHARKVGHSQVLFNLSFTKLATRQRLNLKESEYSLKEGWWKVFYLGRGFTIDHEFHWYHLACWRQ